MGEICAVFVKPMLKLKTKFPFARTWTAGIRTEQKTTAHVQVRSKDVALVSCRPRLGHRPLVLVADKRITL